MANAEHVDAAMNQHLSEEIERLERENASLRELLNRPVTVNAPINYTQTPYQSSLLAVLQNMNTTLQAIQYALQSRPNPIPTYPTTTYTSSAQAVTTP